MQSPELIRGTLQTIILKLLSDNGRMYGYEITQKVKELSDGKILLTEGALYPTLHKLEKEAWLITETEHFGRRVRKYYALTPQGAGVASQKTADFQEFIQLMQAVLNINLKPLGS